MDSRRIFKRLLLQEAQLKVEDVAIGNDIVVQLRSEVEARTCPSCAVASDHIHSRYSRNVQDLTLFTARRKAEVTSEALPLSQPELFQKHLC